MVFITIGHYLFIITLPVFLPFLVVSHKITTKIAHLLVVMRYFTWNSVTAVTKGMFYFSCAALSCYFPSGTHVTTTCDLDRILPREFFGISVGISLWCCFPPRVELFYVHFVHVLIFLTHNKQKWPENISCLRQHWLSSERTRGWKVVGFDTCNHL